eukprot:jgi/Psemu1/61494/gm1.61494_g
MVTVDVSYLIFGPTTRPTIRIVDLYNQSYDSFFDHIRPVTRLLQGSKLDTNSTLQSSTYAHDHEGNSRFNYIASYKFDSCLRFVTRWYPRSTYHVCI